MKKTADHELFTAVSAKSVDLGYKTYPFNPPEGTPYPFVKLGQVHIIPRPTKSYLLGTAIMQVDVWGDAYSRGTVSEMAHNLIHEASKIRETPNGLKWSLEPKATTTEIRTDDSTSEDLWRSLIYLQFSFY